MRRRRRRRRRMKNAEHISFSGGKAIHH